MSPADPAFWTLPAALLVTGLLSGVHCVAMCGGIVGAFSTRRVVPIVAAPADAPGGADLGRIVAFNAGRISTYAAAGMLAGVLGSAGAAASGVLPWQLALYVLANLMLILIGLHLAGAGTWLARLEGIGMPLWRRLQPLASRLLDARSASESYAAGLVWGALPCGLVYAALASAVFAGSPARGALAMAAFGLGTLPNLLLAGIALTRLRRWVAHRALRVVAGSIVLGFGVVGLARATQFSERIGNALFCL